jgi:IS5 family transposase
MQKQQSLSDIEYANRKRKTKREKFLEMMDKIIPWDAFIELIQPHYYKGVRGRPPIGIETMLRMYFIQTWFSLSDEKVEDEIYDSYAFRTFIGIDFYTQQVPDATILCLFRKLLEENELTIGMFGYIKKALDDNGLIMHGGSIVDAAIFDAPSSTKNEKNKRDPEMGSTQKNGQWRFGAKLHIGVDAGTGYIHDFETTSANVHDITVTHALIRPDDHVFYGDAGFLGLEKREEMQADFPDLEYRINVKPSTIPRMSNGQREQWSVYIESRKSSVRSKVEHPFHIIKNLDFVKLRTKAGGNLKRGFLPSA